MVSVEEHRCNHSRGAKVGMRNGRRLASSVFPSTTHKTYRVDLALAFGHSLGPLFDA